MGQEKVCRICEKKCAPNFANLFDSKVKVYDCDDYMISYFEAMQQLTGMEVCNLMYMKYIHHLNETRSQIFRGFAFR